MIAEKDFRLAINTDDNYPDLDEETYFTEAIKEIKKTFHNYYVMPNIGDTILDNGGSNSWIVIRRHIGVFGLEIIVKPFEL
tara:strand:- start:200 stop:442 length:243 start_codon:yes stop_codon:yes gene_type:complete